MKKYVLVIVVFVLLLVESCVTHKPKVKQTKDKKYEWVPFTQKVIKDNDITPEEFDSLQYCIGPVGIILERFEIQKSKVIKNGKLIARQLKTFYRDTIKPFTPGLMIGGTTKMMSVSFEADSLFLFFEPADNRYFLLPLKNTDKTYYGNYLWNIISGYGSATLYFDFNSLKRIRKIGSVAPGRLIKGKDKSKSK